MSTIFLSHTSIDKPFVEKLAGDLQRLGIDVWYDKYEIKVGESILWKIDEGIRESEYLGIVISREAWESEWVKTEIAAAWQKQVKLKGNFVLPIYYRECEIPLFLSGLKYADFRTDYQAGLSDLVKVFGIRDLDAITQDNWRKFTRNRKNNWKEFRDREFELLITRVCRLARFYNFNVWAGMSQNPYSFVIRGWISKEANLGITVRMDPKRYYRYVAADTKEINPNRIPKNIYQMELGNTVNEVEEYLCHRIQAFVDQYGRPAGQNMLFTDKRMSVDVAMEQVLELMRQSNWDQNAYGGSYRGIWENGNEAD